MDSFFAPKGQGQGNGGDWGGSGGRGGGNAGEGKGDDGVRVVAKLKVRDRSIIVDSE